MANEAAPDFASLGATFNDATRFLVGGLWQNTVEEGAQGLGSVNSYVSDLQTVQSGLQAEIAAGQFTGDTLTNVQAILNDITTALSAAPASVNGGGSFGSVAAAEKALHDSHVDVLNIVQNDPNLAALATANGATGFQAVPSALPDGVTAATAPHANLAEIGTIFNDAANRILGGVNADNAGIITDDVNAVIADMQQLMQEQPLLFGGLTGVHADTVVRQLQLELNYINQAGVTPDAGRASNDNILDIIDIVQGDTNLANMANQGGVSGFSPFADGLTANPRFQDNADQTNFWANFMADSNSLGERAQQLVGSGDDQGIATLISDLQTFQKNATDFDAAQGGIFEARFDNELLGDTSTLGAEVSAMIKGLQTGNKALVAAAAEEMHANAADVSGNNIPENGGNYNPDGLTVAEVLGTAVASNGGDPAGGGTSTNPPADAGDPPTTTPPANAGDPPATTPPANTGSGSGQGTGQGNGHANHGFHGDPGAGHFDHSQLAHFLQQHFDFHHLWG